MTTRRDFLRKTTIALAGGLIVGDAAMELFERLTHKKVYALGGYNEWPHGLVDMLSSSTVYGLHTSALDHWKVAPAKWGGHGW